MNGSELQEQVIAVVMALAAVPAPTGREHDRAVSLAEWWKSVGVSPVFDSAGNVVAPLGPSSSPDRAVVVCAHLDTVFDEQVDHTPRRTGSEIQGPGVADDTLGLAALTVLPGLLRPEVRRNVWAVATTGEEGLGNLAGITHFLDTFEGKPELVIAVEGTELGEVICRGVGSSRRRITLTAQGGHAWEQSERPSAIHELARFVAQIDELIPTLEVTGKTTVNVGRVDGGEAINARATKAMCDIDLRAVEAGDLDALIAATAGALQSLEGVEVSTEELGFRPAGGIPEDHPLVRCAHEALRGVGIDSTSGSGSTDANAAYARGIPAVTIGVSRGGEEHTLREWLDTEPLEQGLEALASTVTCAVRLLHATRPSGPSR